MIAKKDSIEVFFLKDWQGIASGQTGIIVRSNDITGLLISTEHTRVTIDTPADMALWWGLDGDVWKRTSEIFAEYMDKEPVGKVTSFEPMIELMSSLYMVFKPSEGANHAFLLVGGKPMLQIATGGHFFQVYLEESDFTKAPELLIAEMIVALGLEMDQSGNLSSVEEHPDIQMDQSAIADIETDLDLICCWHQRGFRERWVGVLMTFYQYGKIPDNVWVTSDHHFGHSNIIKFCKRPFESADDMDQAMIDAWNSVVSPHDVVFHLGDFTLSGLPEAREYFSKLNGVYRHPISGMASRQAVD